MLEPALDADRFYDAGDAGCAGPALREIAGLIDALPPGGALEIRSTTDAGRAALRAFCRMRGFRVEREDAGPDADRILIRRPEEAS